MPRTLVLGIGNLLMGDEGVGVRVIETLTREAWPADVALVDGGTGGFHLLEYLRDFNPIIMIDAAMDGRPAGTVGLIRPKYASDFPRALTAHDIGLRDLVEAAQLTGALPDIHLITVSIVEIQSMELRLSPEVAAAIPEACAAVRRAVSVLGVAAHA
jgi:hydrogenase maturation protease